MGRRESESTGRCGEDDLLELKDAVQDVLCSFCDETVVQDFSLPGERLGDGAWRGGRS